MALINRIFIGSSDYSQLIIANYNELKHLSFGRDGSYSAKVIYDSTLNDLTPIPPHFKEVARFENWMKIYDDEGLVTEIRSDVIIVYRAGELGCIIHAVNVDHV